MRGSTESWMLSIKSIKKRNSGWKFLQKNHRYKPGKKRKRGTAKLREKKWKWRVESIKGKENLEKVT